METKTHKGAKERLVGKPLSVVDDQEALVELVATGEMSVDETGLVHGGFTFGVADYAAMLAVNHPNVVLGGTECRFVAPVRVGDKMTAKAFVSEIEGRKRKVEVEVSVGDQTVLRGLFTCFVLDKHVLEN